MTTSNHKKDLLALYKEYLAVCRVLGSSPKTWSEWIGNGQE